MAHQEAFGVTWAQEQQTINDPPLYIYNYNYTLYVYTYILFIYLSIKKKHPPFSHIYGHRSLPFPEAASITKVLN